MVINAICNCWPSQSPVNAFPNMFVSKAATLTWQVKAVNRTICHLLEVFQKFPSAAKVLCWFIYHATVMWSLHV